MTQLSMNDATLIKRQTGVTMLEVLVAIVVLSFGMLGMLGLITNGLKMTSSSNYRTIAAQQLTEMAEMINANPYFTDAYALPSNTSTPTCLTSAGCSTAQLPNTDYALWLANLAQSLPSGKGVVCYDATPKDGNSTNFNCSNTGRLTVKICWNENARIGISGGGVSGSDSSNDTCIFAQI